MPDSRPQPVHPSVREVAVLQEATEMILASMDLDTVLHQILLIVRNYFGVTTSAVFLVDAAAGDLYCRAHDGHDERISTRRESISDATVLGWVAQQRSPLYVPDVRNEPRYVASASGVLSELAIPLVVREEVLGVLLVESEQQDYFSDDIIGLLALFATQAAVALENARLYSSERRRMRQIELINLLARSATSAADVDHFLSTLADLIFDSFDGAEVAVLLRDRREELSLRAHAGSCTVDPRQFAASQRDGIIARALDARMNVAANDLDPSWPACLPGSGSELCVPLVSFGEVLGVIVVAHMRSRFFGTDDRSIAQAAGDVCATAIKNVQLADELRRLTNTDSLTGAYNQRYFHAVVAQEVNRGRRYGKHFSLLLLDLRRFRQVNESLGFDRGDEVLRQVSERLRADVRSNDVVCRFAGDCFALVLPETDAQQLATVLAKITQGLARIQVEGAGGPRSLAAAHAAAYYPQDGASELDLVRQLFARMDQAKQQMSASAGR